MSSHFIIELSLCLLLVWLAWRALSVTSVYSAIASYIAFGLLMAIAWALLNAPDIALAEAALGTGLTSVLLLLSLRHYDQHPLSPLGIGPSITAGASCVGLWVLLCSIIEQNPPGAESTAQKTIESIADTGIEQPVTAVLLIFRAFDTLLEVAVVVVALIVVRSLHRASTAKFFSRSDDLVLRHFTRTMFPLALIIGYYLFWAGSHAPGGAFQAAAVLAAGGLFLLLANFDLPSSWRVLPWTFLSLCGLLFFLLVGWIGIIYDGIFLSYPTVMIKPIVITIEALLSVSLAFVLVGFVTQGRAYPYFAKSNTTTTAGEPRGDHD